MKISGAPPSPALPRQDEAPRSPGGNGTFGFDELGVFGLKERGPGMDPGGKRAADLARPLPAHPEEKERPPVGRSGPDDVANEQPPKTPPPAEPDRPRIQSNSPQPRLQPEPHMVEIGPAGELAAIELEAESEGSSAGDAPVARSPATEAGSEFSLRLVEKDGRVSIMAGSPPLDAEGRALLRRLMREILAGRGLSLADFQLNGVPFGADFLDMTGGSHGPRSR